MKRVHETYGIDMMDLDVQFYPPRDDDDDWNSTWVDVRKIENRLPQ
jgi:hypothetical protein